MQRRRRANKNHLESEPRHQSSYKRRRRRISPFSLFILFGLVSVVFLWPIADADDSQTHSDDSWTHSSREVAEVFDDASSGTIPTHKTPGNSSVTTPAQTAPAPSRSTVAPTTTPPMTTPTPQPQPIKTESPTSQPPKPLPPKTKRPTKIPIIKPNTSIPQSITTPSPRPKLPPPPIIATTAPPKNESSSQDQVQDDGKKSDDSATSSASKSSSSMGKPLTLALIGGCVVFALVGIALAIDSRRRRREKEDDYEDWSPNVQPNGGGGQNMHQRISHILGNGQSKSPMYRPSEFKPSMESVYSNPFDVLTPMGEIDVPDRRSDSLDYLPANNTTYRARRNGENDVSGYEDSPYGKRKVPHDYYDSEDIYDSSSYNKPIRNMSFSSDSNPSSDEDSDIDFDDDEDGIYSSSQGRGIDL